MAAVPTRIAFPLFALLLASKAFAQSGDRRGDQQTSLPASPRAPPAPPLSVEGALRKFRLPAGLRIEVVAADPLVRDPVAIAFGPDGRIWVAEMRGYMPNVDGTGEDAANGTTRREMTTGRPVSW